MARQKKEDVWFIISKSGNKKTQVNFYDKKGKTVPPDKLNVKYKNPDTGRFVTEKYSKKEDHVVRRIPSPGYGDARNARHESNSKTFSISRDSRSGKFIPEREARKHPNSTTVERIPKGSPIHFEKDRRRK